MRPVAILAAWLVIPALAVAQPEQSPRPPDRGAEATGLPDMDEEPGLDQAEEVVPDAPPVRAQLAASETEFAACLADLTALGAGFSRPDPVVAEDDRDCGILQPVEVTEIVPGVALNPAGTMRCDTALALARWTRDFVLPAAATLPGREGVTAIQQGSTYICRRRNNATDGKPSEHSFGNAVDVMRFDFGAGPPIAIQPREREGSPAEAFQDAVRATACLHFTTVIGPGTDAAHADHLHLDIKERRGGFRLCQ